MGTGSSYNQDPVMGIAFKPGPNEDTGPQLARSQNLKHPEPPGRHTLLQKSTNLNKPSDKALHANLDFYRGKIISDQGRGHSIDEMLEWRGNYKELEQNHSYIQWLFPIPESNGMNYFAQALQEHESEVIKNDESLQDKVIAAFEMMLDFYGMELTKTTTVCTIQKCEGNWKERYENLNRSSHNFLRITRILISLGQFGLERFQKPWVTFILIESYVNKDLERLKGGSVSHWINAISDIDERQETTALHEELNNNYKQTETSKKGRMLTDSSNNNDVRDEIQDTCVGKEDRVDNTKQINIEKINSETTDFGQEMKTDNENNKAYVHTCDTGQEPINEHNATKHDPSTISHVNTMDKNVNTSDSKNVSGNGNTSTESCTSQQIGHATGSDSHREILIKNQDDVTRQNLKPNQGSKLLQDEFTRAESGGQSAQTDQYLDDRPTNQNIQEAGVKYINANRDSNSLSEDFQQAEGGQSVQEASQFDGHNVNLLFYQGKILSNEGYTIEDMLSWWGHYDVLDENDQYIQWLFPISSGTGANKHAQPLEKHEIEGICDDPCLYEKYLYAIQMMLNFYGMDLVCENREVFYIKRAVNWKTQFAYLNRAPHNYLRITRVLKSIGEMGYDKLQLPLLSFLFNEVFTQRTLTNITRETIDYWIEALYEENDKSDMLKLYRKMSA